MKSATRTSTIATLFAGLLICVAFVAGCGGEETREEDAEDPSTGQDAQRTEKESTEESVEARTDTSGGKASSGDAALEMRSDEETEFSGSCTVGDETSEVEGQTPESFSYKLDGQRLECEINADGNLEVIFTAGGSTRSVQQVNGGTLNLVYDNGQISSSSTSSGSGGNSSSSQVVSSSQSSSSSIQISP